MRVFQTLLAFSGNAQPQLAVTRRLVNAGHHVRVLAHEAARERVLATGAELVPFTRAKPELDISRREHDTLRDWQARTWASAGIRLLRNGIFAFTLDVSRDCAEQLAAWPADVVLYDWMLTGAGVAADGAHVPAVALVHCPYPYPVPGAPPMFAGLSPIPGALGATRDRLASAIAGRMFDLGRGVLNKARAEHGLAPLAHWRQQLERAHAVCILHAPELDFTSAGRLPANVRYVGPSFEPYPTEWCSPWPPEHADPLVVISLSTSYMDQASLAQRILDAVSVLPVRALLTVGPALELERLRIPANARTVSYVAHRTVFPHAALVISHAGWQTISAALADGVPLVCIPGGRDQPDNAARVLALGAGVRARPGVSTERLRALISRALADPALARGAQAAARAQARCDGAGAVVEQLERMAGARAVEVRA
ncbi:MAG TPA: nucleotide disphospho-sugar-binding domain-containing protein [Solirubrobacteraceae bacterium]|jgi:MGT family glycosyltransferase|nr:nucleotide disphospho-sugar-binding domain-containing protein [Solirubrobacteraceae bacterium]